MSGVDRWQVIRDERRSLTQDLRSIDLGQWSAKSLCDDWTVQDVLAHMTGTAKLSMAGFFPKFIGSGFSLNKLQAKDIARWRGATPAEGLANFEAIVDSKGAPPGPPDTMLGEVLIHCEDIRRPLGIAHTYPIGAAVQVADFFKGSNLIIGTKKRIAGVTLKATDTDWTHGTGPEAAGPIVSIMMAMTGRKEALAELSGPGVDTLRSRP